MSLVERRMQPPDEANNNSIKNPLSSEWEVQQVLAKYVRAADHLDGETMSNLFTPDGKVEVYSSTTGKPELLFVLSGQDAIANAFTNLMKPHPARGWSHHTTHDLIIEVTGHHATIDAQFIRFDALGYARPDTGWPFGVSGAMGTITPTESGYYQSTLQRVNEDWKIVHHRVVHDLPFVTPENR